MTGAHLDRFKITENRWLAWQMIPGYFGERSVPYCSPIYVTRFRPLKTGKSIVRMAFHNALYAEGVQGFQLDMRILKRSQDYLISELLYGDHPGFDRCAVISHIELAWVERFCPELWAQHPPSSTKYGAGSVSLYLNEVFFGSADGPD